VYILREAIGIQRKTATGLDRIGLAGTLPAGWQQCTSEDGSIIKWRGDGWKDGKREVGREGWMPGGRDGRR